MSRLASRRGAAGVVLGGPLPNGRHFLPREVVERNQRQRLLDAVPVVVAEHGCAGLTVEKVIAAAGVSRRTFYEFFADAREAMLATYDAIFARLLAAVERACAAEPDWPSGVRAAIAAALGFAAAEPAAARLLSVDTFSFSPEGARRVLASHERLAGLLASGREDRPRAAQLPAITERALVSGIWTTIGSRLLEGTPERLAELELQLAELTLMPYLGAEASSSRAAS